ncbi:MAG: hypothetical protein V8Q09_04195 [Adlercreutzia sp.]
MAATEISVDHIARVEGHGDIRLVIEDGQVTTCEMAVVEPARLFESMVRGAPSRRCPTSPPASAASARRATSSPTCAPSSRSSVWK